MFFLYMIAMKDDVGVGNVSLWSNWEKYEMQVEENFISYQYLYHQLGHVPMSLVTELTSLINIC